MTQLDLQQKLEQAELREQSAAGAAVVLSEQIELVKAERDALQQQVNALAAEGDKLLNERLRMLEKLEAQSLYISALEVERKAFERLTPDAVTREIGAKAVEGFVDSLAPAWNGTTERALNYAAQLRQPEGKGNE